MLSPDPRPRYYSRGDRSETPPRHRSSHDRERSRGHRSSSWLDALPQRASGTSRPPGGPVILEALPDRPDPAGLGGPMAIPDAGTRVATSKSSTHSTRGDGRGGHGGHGVGDRVGRAPSDPPGSSKKESVQDRLRRLRAAQFNRQVQKDALVATQKMIQANREQQARNIGVVLVEPAPKARSPSPTE